MNKEILILLILMKQLGKMNKKLDEIMRKRIMSNITNKNKNQLTIKQWFKNKNQGVINSPKLIVLNQIFSN